MEQIRLDLSYQNIPVVLVGVGGGFAYGTGGPTHHAVEDISQFRAFPNMTVVCPADPVEMEEVTHQAINLQGPSYIRICRNKDPVIHTKPVNIQIGRSIILREGKDAAIIATGGMVHEALETARLLAAQNIEARVVSMHTVKPADTQMIAECAAFPALFTMEENTIIGGLGSCVAENIAGLNISLKIFHMFGFPDSYAMVAGTRDYLNAQFGLDAPSMAGAIHGMLRNTQ
jgi:transketolase